MRTSEHGGVSDTVSLLLTLASERWGAGVVWKFRAGLGVRNCLKVFAYSVLRTP